MTNKREVVVYDALLMRGKLFATLKNNDDVRGWPAGKHIITTTVNQVGTDRFESKNTIYKVEGELRIYTGEN